MIILPIWVAINLYALKAISPDFNDYIAKNILAVFIRDNNEAEYQQPEMGETRHYQVKPNEEKKQLF